MQTITINSAKMNEEIQKFIDKFRGQYGMNPKRLSFFNEELPRFAERIFVDDFDMDKLAWDFVKEYRDVRQCGGFNATYGNLYHWFKDYAAVLLGYEDWFDYSYSKK